MTSAVLSPPGAGRNATEKARTGAGILRAVSVAGCQLLGLGLAGPGGTGLPPAPHGDTRRSGAGRPGRTSDSEGLCCLHDVGGRVGTKTSGENSSWLSCASGWDAD